MAGDLRDDPRASDLLAADPEPVSALAVMFLGVATRAQSSADGLRGAGADASWSGDAADAFRQGLGKVPDDLDKVTLSHQEASDALNAYEGDLSQIKPVFESILARLDGAQSQLSSSRSQLSEAQFALNTANAKAAAVKPAPGAPPPGAVPPDPQLHTAVNAANGALANAQGEIAALTSQGLRLLEEFDAARGSAQSRVSSASHVPPHRSFWDSVFHDVGNWMTDAGKFVVDVAKGIGNSVASTIPDLEKFIQDPTLANFGKLAGDVAVDASIVVLLAAAPEALGVIGAAEVAADAAADGAAEESVGFLARAGGALASTGSPAADVAEEASVLKADSDLLQGHYADAAVDLVFARLPDGDDVADMAGIGDEAAEGAKTTSEALQTYKELFVDRELEPGVALAMMTDGEVDAVLHSVEDITDPGQVVAATDQATTQAVSKARIAAAAGRPVAFAADSILDHTSDAASDKLRGVLHPKPSTCP